MIPPHFPATHERKGRLLIKSKLSKLLGGKIRRQFVYEVETSVELGNVLF